MKKNKKNQVVWPQDYRVDSVIVQYVDVGNMSASAITSFLYVVNQQWSAVIEQLKKQHIAVIQVPVRPNSQTRFEIMHVKQEVSNAA